MISLPDQLLENRYKDYRNTVQTVSTDTDTDTHRVDVLKTKTKRRVDDLPDPFWMQLCRF